MAKGLAERLYMGEANLNIVGRRKMWFTIAAALVVLAIGSFVIRGFHLGIEFSGGTQFQLPASVGSAERAQSAVEEAIAKTDVSEEATVGAAQQVGSGGTETYNVRTSALTQAESNAVKQSLVQQLGVPATSISDNRVSAAWGGQVTQQALLGLGIFLVLVLGYLVVRFEWRMAVAAVSSLLLDLVLTAGVYSLVGFEVTPSTVIGFLTILGFSLYDVVVVFDKVQENTRGITAGSTRTYSEATNLAVNQTLMRSINTGLVALLPVGGLLFIGAGLLGAGTLKDLGLVLFVGMGLGVLSSIVFASPMLAALKDQEPRIKSHNARVLARRSSSRSGDVARGERTRTAGTTTTSDEVPALAGTTPSATPRPGARPTGKRGGNRGGGAGNRPSGGQKRR
ncbi:protein-export membrane protein SecF [Actinoplanes sp. NBRC 14428]|uniref:Protein-export membrane protein SecF n=1 Tax=Pseudosporangium ferrugineum TaxID=439699 RepID=A0A2T0S2B8_9ACTN|nr:protein translocase subunit SecF [Pseudosporangium ferrugineum]PRY27561.1 protein translocase subunit secF [Pseudosporangium ferrugineum]BCJ55671.1 protein-export membrane protein SecF [Actinoplanes sp. NBRC 14428]